MNKKERKSPEPQSVKDAIANIEAKKEVILERPKMIATGKGVGSNGSVMFDSVPDGIKVAYQVAVIIDIYFELIGNSHKFVTIQELCDYAEDHHSSVFETQGLAAVLNHYKKEIELLLPPHDGINFKYYVWNKMSGIPWHNDHNHHFAGTLYLNEKWNTDYGGVFLYREKRDDVEFNAVAPAQNMLVLNDSKQDHMVTPISPLAPEDRITIQLWGF